MAYKGFETFQEAFDYCREANHPVDVVVTGEIVWKLYKLYPSGRVVFIRIIPKYEEIMEV